MTSEVVNLRERIEKVRAEMAGEDFSNDKNLLSEKDNILSNDNNNIKSIHSENKSDLPDFKLTVQNPVSPKVLLFLIIMQLITSIVLVTVIYFKWIWILITLYIYFLFLTELEIKK